MSEKPQETGERKVMLEFRIDRTRAYVMHKGRLPKDATELIEWLNEFAEWEIRVADCWEQQLKEHMNSCSRPIILDWRLGERVTEGSERK